MTEIRIIYNEDCDSYDRKIIDNKINERMKNFTRELRSVKNKKNIYCIQQKTYRRSFIAVPTYIVGLVTC